MYGKIFEEIFDSTIVAHGGDVVYVFIAMIVLSDAQGYLRITTPALAARIAKPIKEVHNCIKILEHPDPDSNTPDYNGRRIVAISELTDGLERRGWLVVNKEKFRDIASIEDRKQQNREAKRRQRLKEMTGKECADVSATVSNGQHESAMSAHTDADTNTDNNKIYVEKSNSRRTTADQKEMAKEILRFLNAKAKRNYRPVDANLDLILARIKSGVELQDFKSVIAKKCREWLTDPKMHIYLRPATLFNKTKFEQYLGELYQEATNEDENMS